MGALNEKTTEKRETIKSMGCSHITMHECQLKNNKEFQKSAKKHNKEKMVEPLNTRDAFYELMQANSYMISKKINVR